MFEQLIGLFSLIIDGISKIKLRKSIKRRIGKELAKLYIGLNEVVNNGKEILKILEDSRKGQKVDIPNLMTLLYSQADRIRRIRSIIDKSNLKTILSIHLPKLEDLKILLGMKGERIAVLTQQYKAQNLKYFKPVDIYYMSQMTWWSQTKLVPPTKGPLNKSKYDLAELKRINILLQKLIVDKFKIDEII